MKIQPLNDRVVVQRLESEAKTPSGLVIPTVAQEKPVQAKVVAVGPGRTLEGGEIRKPTVKPGDTVLFSKYSGAEVKLHEEDFLIMREEDILAVLG